MGLLRSRNRMEHIRIDPRAYGFMEDVFDHMLHMADRDNGNMGIDILRAVYFMDRSNEGSERYLDLASDDDVMDWIYDYWRFCKRVDHGNGPSLSEVGFEGFLMIFIDPEERAMVCEQLYSQDDPSTRTERGRVLYERLMDLME